MEAASYPLQEVLAASSAEPRSEWAQRLSTGAEFALSLSSRGQRPRGGSSTGLGVTNSSRDGTTPSPRPRSAANSNGGAGPLRPGQAGPPGNGRTPPPTSRGGGIPHLVHGGNPQLVHLGSSPGQGRRRRPMFYLDSTSMSGGQLRRTWGNRRARVLEANMRANGVRPPGVALPRGTTWTAHHIVPGTQNMVVVSGPRILGPTKFQSFDPNIISARTHLVNLGISAGDASNGVFLPHVRRRGAANAANRTPPNNMPLHNQIHTPRYFQEVWNRLQGTTTPQQARQALAQISSDLQRGQFPF